MKPLPPKADPTALDQINLYIKDKEASTLEFTDSKPSSDGTANLLTFDQVEESPALLTVVLKGDPAPKGTKNVWKGKMIVEGKEQDVEAYRA